MNLNTKLLGILPAVERLAKAKPAVKNTSARTAAYENGLEGLKNLILDRSASDFSSFKYDKAGDRLYAYLKSQAAADRLFADATSGQRVYEKISVGRSGQLSVRFDQASKFAKSVAISAQEEKLSDWATFVVDHKQIFRDVFGTVTGSTITFKLNESTNTMYAYATSTRNLETENLLAKRILIQRVPDVTFTNVGAYGVSVKFVFDPAKTRVTPVIDTVTAQPPVSTLREALTVAIGPDLLEPIRDRVSAEVYEQFQRILEGERLPPMPLIARYRDAEGVLFSAFYTKSGERVDIEALLAAMRLQDRPMHTLSSDISHVIVGGSRIDKPALILMPDVINATAVHVTVVAPGVNKQYKLYKQK